MTTFSLSDALAASANESSEQAAGLPLLAAARDVNTLPDPSDINDSLVNRAVDLLAGEPDALLSDDKNAFDVVLALIAHARLLSPAALHKLLDLVLSSCHAALDRAALSLESTAAALSDDTRGRDEYRAHVGSLEAHAFLLHSFVLQAEGAGTRAGPATGFGAPPSSASSSRAAKGKKGKSAATTFDWSAHVVSVLDTLCAQLSAHKVRSSRLWHTSSERTTYVSCVLRAVNRLAENEAHMRPTAGGKGHHHLDVRARVCKAFALAARHHQHAFQCEMAVLQNLQYFEHLAEPMAELVATTAGEPFNLPSLADGVLKEISRKEFTDTSANQAGAARAFARFLVRLAELDARAVMRQIAVLHAFVDGDAYSLRIAMIDVLGTLIRHLAKDLAMQTDNNTSNGASTAAAAEADMDADKTQREIESFFELIHERFLDLNAFVRAKVTSVLLKLCDLPPSAGKLPAVRLRTLELATRALRDKSSHVRKGALALVTRLVQTHAYGRLHGGELRRADWQARLDGIQSEMRKLGIPDGEQDDQPGDREARKLLADADADDGDAEDNEVATKDIRDTSDTSDTEGTEKKKRRPRRSLLDLDVTAQDDALAAIPPETLTRVRLTRRYYVDALAFVAVVERAVPVAAELIASSVRAEVLEAIDLFKTLHEYRVESAEMGIRRMLHLIWSKDDPAPTTASADAAPPAATTGGAEPETGGGKGIRSRLIECYSQLYFEPLEGLAPKDQVNRVAKNMIELTRDATLAELTSLEQLIAVMMARGSVEDEVVQRLWSVYHTSKDIPRFQRRGAIIMLGMLAASKPDVVASHVEWLLKIGLGQHGKQDLVLAKYTCIALGRLAGTTKKVKGSLDNKSTRLPMDNAIFAKLAEIIQHTSSTGMEWFAMAEQALNTIYVLGDQPDALTSDIIRHMTRRVFGDALEHGDATLLAQLLFVAGHCAVKQLVHLELIEKEFKRRRAEETKATAGKDKDEIEQVAGSVEDDIGDAIAHAREREIMHAPNSLLSVFGPMSAAVVSQPKVYKNTTLQTAATLALGKFMCVSSQFCEDHLMLLFKVLETSHEPAVRSNIVITLGDLAVCFSNIMDENSDRLYAGLHDKDLTVKKNTLMVLTHLILNGMIKVKGQLGEMAKCLGDEDKRISDLAHLFFTELSTKDKQIYNNLPDIISHLSMGAHAVDEDTFAKSIRFIFGFVDKKREAEVIVEKLCQRFRVAPEPRQWRDIAFCLSLLPFNSEIAVRRLVEGLPFYQDKLHDEIVFKRFQEILTKARTNKATKNESDLKEFDDALEQHRSKSAEDVELEQKAQREKKRANRRRVRRRDSSDDDE